MYHLQQTSPDGDVIADINYFAATGAPITTSMWKKPALGERGEFTRAMTIHDARTSGRSFHLDTNGFTFIKLPSKPRIAVEDDEETVKREYYPELEHVTKDLYKLPNIGHKSKSITDGEA